MPTTLLVTHQDFQTLRHYKREGFAFALSKIRRVCPPVLPSSDAPAAMDWWHWPRDRGYWSEAVAEAAPHLSFLSLRTISTVVWHPSFPHSSSAYANAVHSGICSFSFVHCFFDAIWISMLYTIFSQYYFNSSDYVYVKHSGNSSFGFAPNFFFRPFLRLCLNFLYPNNFVSFLFFLSLHKISTVVWHPHSCSA